MIIRKEHIFGALLIASTLVGTASASEITGTLSAGGGASINVPAPTPGPATYSAAQNVTLAASGATSIRYTLDGTTPSCSALSGTLYTGAISIANSLTLNAVACYAGGVSSSVGTYSYVIDPGSGSLSGSVGSSPGGSLGGTVGSSPGGSLSGTVGSSPGGSLSGTVGSSAGGGGGGGGGGTQVCDSSPSAPACPTSGGGSSGGGSGGTTNPGGGTVLGTSTTSTPGIPNTGAGGEAPMTLALLALSALLALGGVRYLAKYGISLQ